MIKVYCLSTVNLEGATYDTALHTAEAMNVLKDGYRTEILDGLYRHQYCRIFLTKDGMEWASIPLRMRFAIYIDSKFILLPLAIKLSKVASISEAIVRRKATFLDTMQSLLSSARASNEKYAGRFVDMRLLDIVEGMVLWNVFV